jgi:tetratricopeptide (TPR) repeat protein
LSYLKKGEINKAKHIYEEVLDCVGHDGSSYADAEAWKNLALIYSLKRKYGKVIECLRESFGFDYEDRVMAALAEIDYEIEKEVEIYNKRVEADARDKQAWFNLADIYYREGKLEKAISHYEKVLEIDPESVEAWVSLGYVYEELGNKEKAQKCYEEAVGNLGRRLGYPQAKSQTGNSRTRESATGR